jgi:N-acetylneuraminic acid mutarotase
MVRRLSWVMVLSLFGVAASVAGAWASGRWVTAPQMEQGRALLSAVTVGRQIYVAGGTSLSGPVASFDSFDLAGEDWLTLSPLPEGLQRFGMAAVGDQIVVSGGYSAKHAEAPSAKSWVYDTHSAQWRSAASMPAARAGLVLVTLNNAVYAIGGTGAAARQVYRYDLTADRWSNAFTPMPDERSGHTAVAIGNKIYVIGGQGANGKATASVLVLDTAHGTWSQGPKLPTPLSGHTSGLIGGQIHVAGGAAPPAIRTSAAHYVLDTAKAVWQEAPAMPAPSQGLASAVVGERWVVMGGSAGSGFFSAFTPVDAVYVYSPN